MRCLLMIVLCLLSAVSCATSPRPSPEQLNSADYGPLPEMWNQIVSNTLADELVRPETLYIRKIEPPVKSWVMTPQGEFVCGWGVCGLVVMGISQLEPFFVLIHYDKPIYKVLGFGLAKRVPGKTWIRRGVSGRVYKDCCPNLLKN